MKESLLPQRHVCGLPHKPGVAALGVPGQHRLASHRRPEPDSPPGAGLYGAGLCPWAEEAEQCNGAVHLPGASGYGEL